MSTYKVIQDVEAEDKLVGPLTLRQFIYAGIAALSLYLGFLCITKGAAFMLALFLPITGVTGFFAFPWGQDQPTEVWALAKIRFMLKPRLRIWDQLGQKELVTITAPKRIERRLTNGLNQEEVQSRLSALANTIDSRGWAVKNANLSLASPAAFAADTSDRLVSASSLPQEVSNIDVRASDDMLDEASNPVAQHFDSMISAATTAHRQELMSQMQQPVATPVPAAPAQPAADYWFMHQPAPAPGPGQATFTDDSVVLPGAQQTSSAAPQAATPTADEEALVEKFRAENSSQTVAYAHLKTLKTPEQLSAAQQAEALASAATQKAVAVTPKPPVTPDTQAAIMNLANNDDLDVATIARQAHKHAESDDGEVLISLR